jgi:methionine biosynthesis protein MetW
MGTTEEYYRSYWGQGLDNWTPRLTPLYDGETRVLARYIREGAAVLDVGCGDGKVARALASKNVTYRGIDISQDALDLCKEQGFEAKFHNLDEPLPLADGSIDAITIFEVLEHLFLPHTTIDELARVLKPGGLLIGSVPNIGEFANRLLLMAGYFNPGGSPVTSLRTPWKDPHIRFFTYQSMRAMLSASPMLEVVDMPGTAFQLTDQPILYRSSGAVRAILNAIQQPLRPLGRIWPSPWSHRVYFVARKK